MEQSALQLPVAAPVHTCSSTLWAMRVAPSSSSATLMGRTLSATWEGRSDPCIEQDKAVLGSESTRGSQDSPPTQTPSSPVVSWARFLGPKESQSLAGQKAASSQRAGLCLSLSISQKPMPWGWPQGKNCASLAHPN